jgi:uncharacterized protein involved in exopolysaccharide biosynthesis
LPKVIVKEVIKDLIKGDASKREVVVLNDVVAQKRIQLTTKDTIIANLQQQIFNFESIISNKDKQGTLAEQLNKDLEKALRKSKRRTFFYKVGTGVGVLASLLLLSK